MTSKTIKNQGRTGRKKLTETIKTPATHGILHATLLGAAFSLASCLILLFVVSAVLYRCADPNRYVIPAALCILYFSCFLGGLTGARSNHRQGALLCGVAVSSLLYLILFAFSLLFAPTLSQEYSLPLSFGIRGIGMGVAILGALMGSRNKSTNKNKKRKYAKK